MITINLLPVKQIQKRLKARNTVITFGASLLALFIVLGVVAMVQQGRIDDLKAAIAALQAEKDSYKSTLAEIDKLKKDREVLEKKLAVIAKLRSDSQLTVRLLDEVANLTPPNKLWLISLGQQGGKMALQGMALDDSIIARYMEALEASDYFADAELVNTSQQVVGTQKFKAFSLNCNITSPEKKSSPSGG